MNNPQYMSGTGNNFLVSEYENSKTDIEIISCLLYTSDAADE